MSIPSAYYGRDAYSRSFDEGMGNLVRDAGIANVVNTVDGMLFYIATVSLPNSSTDDERRDICAEARVLRRMKNYLVETITEQNPDPEQEEMLDG